MTKNETQETRETLAHRLYDAFRHGYEHETFAWNSLRPDEQHAWLGVADEAVKTRMKEATTA